MSYESLRTSYDFQESFSQMRISQSPGSFESPLDSQQENREMIQEIEMSYGFHDHATIF